MDDIGGTVSRKDSMLVYRSIIRLEVPSHCGVLRSIY
jgi:hypothetical protein